MKILYPKLLAICRQKKSCGIDELPPHFRKSIKSEIIIPLPITINRSLVTGIFSDKLKIAKVIAIFKKVTLQLLKIIVLFIFIYLNLYFVWLPQRNTPHN